MNARMLTAKNLVVRASANSGDRDLRAVIQRFNQTYNV